MDWFPPTVQRYEIKLTDKLPIEMLLTNLNIDKLQPGFVPSAGYSSTLCSVMPTMHYRMEGK